MYRIKQIAQQTWQITGGAAEYMYLVCGGEKALLIDTGMGFKGLDEVVRSLTDHPVIAVNTHGHFDHAGGNYMFPKVYRHPADQEVYEEHISQEFRQSVIMGFLRESGGEQAAQLEQLLKPADRETVAQDLPPIFHLGGREIEVIESPGHTKGSVCLLDRSERILFSGDTVCDMGIMLSFEHSASVQVFRKSIRTLRQYGAAFDLIYPGHHRSPIEKEYLEEYIECCDMLEQDQSDAVAECSVFGDLYRKGWKRVGIAYTEDKLGR